ncbi:MAG: TonB family protein [Saprospiraceae bacterium]
MKILSFAVSCWLILWGGTYAYGQENTLSPYFYIPNGEEGTTALPLLHTSAEVNIAGVIADVKIRQVYKNDSDQPIEAIYVFPGTTRSAVYGMQMQIKDRVIHAKIQEKGKARAVYEAAKKEGKSASLLEQQRPNVFQMNVANILPGDTIRIELSYTELLTPEAGIYTFVYPTVVGPRYGGEILPEATASTHWIANPYMKEGERAPFTFDLNICLNAGVPIQKVQSPSHQIQVHFKGESEAELALAPTETNGGNRDFLLEYQLAGEQIQDGLLLWSGQEENFFLAMIQAPKQPTPAQITPREYIFLLDVSGSMQGYPLGIAKQVIKDLFQQLQPSDRFNMLFFEGDAYFLSEQSLPATPANLAKAIQAIDQQSGSGGTNMLQAIEKAMLVPKMEGYSRSFAIITDGYVSVEDRIFTYISQHLDAANFFSLGIGSSVNRHLIEGIAQVGMSEAFVIMNEGESKGIANKFRQYIQSPVLTNIALDFQGIDAYDIIPQYIPDLMGERPIVVFGKYKGTPKGYLEITGDQAKGKFKQKIAISPTQEKASNGALPYLWARHQIRLLDDFSFPSNNDDFNDIKTQITQLGLDYSLLTRFTSFVAVDTLVRRHGPTGPTTKQPLPLPKGVPNSAVGQPLSAASFGEEDEPEFQDQSSVNLAGNWDIDIAPPMTTPPPAPPPPAPEVGEVFKIVEEMPILETCQESGVSYQEKKACSDKAILSFFMKNLKLPADMRDNDIGSVNVIQFTVAKDGSVKDIKIVRSRHPSLDKELIRIARLLPRFIPGKQRGRAVEVQFNIPIRVELE